MLVLTRKTNEAIIIGGDIRLTVLGTRNGVVRLGLAAPSDVKIFREELLTRGRQNEKKEEKSNES